MGQGLLHVHPGEDAVLGRLRGNDGVETVLRGGVLDPGAEGAHLRAQGGEGLLRGQGGAVLLQGGPFGPRLLQGLYALGVGVPDGVQLQQTQAALDLRQLLLLPLFLPDPGGELRQTLLLTGDAALGILRAAHGLPQPGQLAGLIVPDGGLQFF